MSLVGTSIDQQSKQHRPSLPTILPTVTFAEASLEREAAVGTGVLELPLAIKPCRRYIVVSGFTRRAEAVVWLPAVSRGVKKRQETRSDWTCWIEGRSMGSQA